METEEVTAAVSSAPVLDDDEFSTLFFQFDWSVSEEHDILASIPVPPPINTNANTSSSSSSNDQKQQQTELEESDRLNSPQLSNKSKWSDSDNTNSADDNSSGNNNNNNNNNNNADMGMVLKKKSRKDKPLEKQLEKNINAIMQMPSKFQLLANTENWNGVRQLFANHFAADCAYQNPAIDRKIVGFNYIIDTQYHLTSSAPDIVLMLKETNFDREQGVMTVKFIFHATKCFVSDPALQQRAREEFKVPPSDPEYEIKNKFLTLLRSGKRVKYCCEINWILHLNSDFTRVQHIYETHRVLSCCEAEDI